MNGTMEPAPGGCDAIFAAGRAVNGRDLRDESAIREALPLAASAAWASKGRFKTTGPQVGCYTGMSVALFQNWLYEQNRDWHFTDGTLCVLWTVEFPGAGCDYPAKRHYIASTRHDYNAGRHRAHAPPIPCVGYDRKGRVASLATAAKRKAAALVVRPVAALETSSRAGEEAAGIPKALHITSDPCRTIERLSRLDQYASQSILDGDRFVCPHFSECRSSHDGEFFEGQSHHVGAHYDLALNGVPFRVMIVGQEYGNGPSKVTRVSRTHTVVNVTGLGKRFHADGIHAPRNPHMRGTTSLLRLLFGRDPGADHEGEFLPLNGSNVHIFEAFALTNFLLCSAIAGGQNATGSKHGKSTKTMQRNCSGHFRRVVDVLEPTLIVAQGKGVRRWLTGVFEHSQPLSPNLERIRYGNRQLLLASFTHPSAHGSHNWGTAQRPYLMDVVTPTVDAVHEEVRCLSGL